MVADYIGLKRNDDVQKAVPEIFKRAPANPEIVAQLANVFLQAGMVGDASELLKLAQTHLKPTASLLTAQANVQARSGHADEARATIKRALELDPNNTDALWGAARLAGNAGEWKQAVEYIKRMQKLTPPQNQVLQNLVYASLQINDLQTAHDAALDLRDLEPNSLDSVLVLSAVLIQGLQWGEAEELVTKALERFPDDKRLRYSAGMAEFNMGKLDDAEHNLRASLGQGAPDAEVYYSLAMMAKQRGDIPGAIELLKNVLAINAKHHKALLSLGQLYLQTNEIEPARAVLERAITEAPDDPQNHYQLAMAYRRLGMAEKAKSQMEEFQKLTVRHVPGLPPGETVPSPR
jgi:tetratricopeptide (TPR) repeat protein